MTPRSRSNFEPMLDVFNYLTKEYENKKKESKNEDEILLHLKEEFNTLFGYTDSKGPPCDDTTEVFRYIIGLYEQNKGMEDERLCQLIKDEFQKLFWLDEGDKTPRKLSYKSSPRKSCLVEDDIDFEF